MRGRVPEPLGLLKGRVRATHQQAGLAATADLLEAKPEYIVNTLLDLPPEPAVDTWDGPVSSLGRWRRHRPRSPRP